MDEERNALENATNNDQIVSFHDQASGQKHSPENGFFVFSQRLTHCQQPVGCVALLRMVDELDDPGIAQVKALELVFGRDNLFCRHTDLDAVDVEVKSAGASARAGND
jgi:hypothetical protein